MTLSQTNLFKHQVARAISAMVNSNDGDLGVLVGRCCASSSKQHLGMFPAFSPQPFDLKGGTGIMRRAQSRSNGRAACASSRSTWRREGGRSGGHHQHHHRHHCGHHRRHQVDITSIIIMDIISIIIIIVDNIISISIIVEFISVVSVNCNHITISSRILSGKYHCHRYGQCWVFAGVVTTVCRAIGLPCRFPIIIHISHTYYGLRHNLISYRHRHTQ